jgi:hypothetical protein
MAFAILGDNDRNRPNSSRFTIVVVEVRGWWGLEAFIDPVEVTLE